MTKNSYAFWTMILSIITLVGLTAIITVSWINYSNEQASAQPNPTIVVTTPYTITKLTPTLYWIEISVNTDQYDERTMERTTLHQALKEIKEPILNIQVEAYGSAFSHIYGAYVIIKEEVK